jgi:hypothetical protein
MTAEKPALRGAVLKYPYKWRRETPEDPPPKQRPVCVIFEIRMPDGNMSLAIVAISDKPNRTRGMSLEIPPEEFPGAGLSQFRVAFVHLDQYNIDRRDNSYNFNPKVKPMGAFSTRFTARIAAELAANIRAKRALRIDRT